MSDIEEKRILVIEDDAHILMSLQHRLKHVGYKVACAPDGEHAKSVVRHFAPHLAIVDIHLPITDGMEFADWTNQHLDYALPKIIITASKDPKLRSSCEILPNSWFVEKPFTSPYLILKVQEALAAVALASE